MKILLVEDNEQLNKALSTLLKRNNYVVDCAFDGEEALIFIKDYVYDVIILDIMLPKINGLEVLKKVRENKIETPILMLTAKSTTEDKINGLNKGADDYLAKPFDVGELLARIKALSRRNTKLNEQSFIEYKDLKLDIDNASLMCGDKKVTLMNKELLIIELLMKAKGQLVSLEKISDNVWNADEYISSENVWVFVSYLRKKLASINSKCQIKTIRYKGYYLE